MTDDVRTPRETGMGHHSDSTRRVDIGVRPYFVTRGRTRPERAIAVEAIVETTPLGQSSLDRLRFESHAIVVACAQSMSVAEVAARVSIPLGVARVLVADLAESGAVQVHDAPARIEDDIPLLQRLINGVRAL